MGITKIQLTLLSHVLRDSTPRFLQLLVGLSVGWSLVASILASRPLSLPQGTYPSHQAPIPAFMPQSQPPGPNFSLQAPVPSSKPKSPPPSPNPSLQAQIPASRPKSQPTGPNPSLQAQILAKRPKPQLQEKEKITHMCESIGPQPLRGRCPAPLTSSAPYLGSARVPLTIKRFCC